MIALMQAPFVFSTIEFGNYKRCTKLHKTVQAF